MEKRQCPSCGSLISSAAIYCLECGQRIDGKRSILDSFSFGEEKAGHGAREHYPAQKSDRKIPAHPAQDAHPAHPALKAHPAQAAHPAPEARPAQAEHPSHFKAHDIQAASPPELHPHAHDLKPSSPASHPHAHDLKPLSPPPLPPAPPLPAAPPSPPEPLPASASSMPSMPSLPSFQPLESAPPSQEASSLPTDDGLRPLCPRCKAPLVLRDHGDYAAHDCLKCGGAFTDLLQTHRIQGVAMKTPPVEDIYYLRQTVQRFKNDGKVLYALCPICGVMMSRSNFAGISGIIIDRCEHHGTWFDSGEIPKVRAFIASGGIVLSKLEEEQKRKQVGKQDNLKQLEDTIKRFFRM